MPQTTTSHTPLYVALTAGLLLTACQPPAGTPVDPGAAGADVSKTAVGVILDLTQGFNRSAATTASTGFITSLRVGTTTFAADMAVKDPMNPTANQNVVAVLSSVDWLGGRGDPVKLKANISTANKQALSLALHNQLSDTSVAVSFGTFAVTAGTTTAYAGITGSNLTGSLTKTDKTLDLALTGTLPDPTVLSPQNWGMSISVAPAPAAQTITVASSATTRVAKSWGVTVTP